MDINSHEKLVMAIDAGTTSSRCILFNKKGEIVSLAQQEFKQFYPKPGWVEHDPIEIWKTQLNVCRKAMICANVKASDISCIGITNQRETTVVWNKKTGLPVYNAIVWQCRRTSSYCDLLKEKGLEEAINKKTGLVIDAYFSGSKIKWILDNVPNARKQALDGDLLFGTIDSWLIWNLTGGKVHAVDYTNASRTMLFNINTLKWDDEILKLFDIPKSMLPEVKPSSNIFGVTKKNLFGDEITISSAIGDQQSALFGQTCFNVGCVKNTYGTGAFLLMNTGNEPVFSKNGLITTIAWGIGNEVFYALEGSVFVAGAVVQWLRDELNIISCAQESELLASQVEDTLGCYVVPAFTGLGAPYWDQYARGTIVGLTRGVNKCHIVRASLESIAYQVNDVLLEMSKEANVPIRYLNADGGAANNKLLLQIQSDISGCKVQVPSCLETTALGAAYLAGLAVGFWKDENEISSNHKIEGVYSPKINDLERAEKIKLWHKAVECSKGWKNNI